MTKQPNPLTPQELAIMKIVWRLGGVTVRDVYEAFHVNRRIAYTTVMTMMNVLETKGYLKKETVDRAYRYHATRPQRAVIASMVREFVDRVFDGASRPLLLHLVQDKGLSVAQRHRLQRLLDEAE
jgi:BlaI family transcriptional regulator, penicillinase repressor